VAEQPEPGFAALLRRLRVEAGLTQEELAEAANLSPRSVSDLERGVHRNARKDTAQLLAGALGLAETARERFVAAARGRGPTSEVRGASMQVVPGVAAAAATRTLPRDSVSFTGRDHELARLVESLASGTVAAVIPGIYAVDGMAGIGKTTLAVHAAHKLAQSFPDGQFFLPLHAHTAGQQPVDPADALASLLLIAGLAAREIPPGLEARAARWRNHVAGKKILLLLDDAAGHEQVRPLLPGTAESLVLITSRRRLAALDDAAQMSLDTLSPAEAAALLVRLAALPSLAPDDAAVAEISRLCGYLPLAIGMLASQLRNHPARTAAGLATELASARDRLALMYAENLSVGAAFDLSFADLDSEQQGLFRKLGLIPGPSVDAYAAASLAGIGHATAQRYLDELYDHHLIAEPAPGRYELHDLLREHARALVAADDPAASEAARGRLLDYYLQGATEAGRHFVAWAYRPRRWAYRHNQPPPSPASTPVFSALSQSAAWLETERANLHAAADYSASHGRSRHAIGIAAAISGFLSTRGYWDQSAALHRTVLAAARQAGDALAEAGALAELGVLQLSTGDYETATASLAESAAMFAGLDNGSGQAYVLGQLGFIHVLTGNYAAAATSHDQALMLARTASDRPAEAAALCSVGLLQHLLGDYTAAIASTKEALALFRDIGSVQGEALALNGLGAVLQETGDYAAAAECQERSLALFRELGELLGEAYALNDLGLVQQETSDYPAAQANHQQALALFGDLGNRVGQAEALNRLGELATRTSELRQAQELHDQALSIAREIGALPEQARALEGLGNSYLRAGDTAQADAHLSQALTIYQRIGGPSLRRVQETIQRHGLTAATNADPA